jgi:twitching motility protein PilT
MTEQLNTSTPQESTPPPNFLAVLRQMLRTSEKVSDLIFSPGRPPQIELAGSLQPVNIQGLEKLTPAHTAGIAKVVIGNSQTALESLEKTGSADLSFSAPGEARFRVNVFK